MTYMPSRGALKVVESWDAATALTSAPPSPALLEYQFLSDVVTAAGLLRYGKRDRGLAERIGRFAFDKMGTLPIMPGPRVYVSGPMSNYHDLNRDAFNAETARLLALGYQVENPADVVLPDGATWADFMRADIPRLLACTHIRMLDGWTMSKGARLEHHIAISLGLEVLTDDDLQEQK